MRKNLIALSAAAFVGGLGLSGSATAGVFADVAPFASDAVREDVRLSGTGHQLIIPYFNNQGTNATLFNVVNSDTVNAKAVKIRFRGASNSDDIFDFQLYMSPGDVWSANISHNAAGISILTTPDKSCTVPSAVGKDSGGPFSTFVLGRLPPSLTGDALAAETREGYVEILTMADIPPNSGASSLFAAIKHTTVTPPATGTPTCSTTTFAALLQTDITSLVDAQTRGFRAPSTGLFANWNIVNVTKSGASSGEALALTAVIPNVGGTNSTAARGNIVWFPQANSAVSLLPASNRFTADASLRDNSSGSNVFTGTTVNAQGPLYAPAAGLPIVQPQLFDFPDLSTPYLATLVTPSATTPLVNTTGVLAVGAGDDAPEVFVSELQSSIATASISNEYLTDTTINAFTDWLLSQPTRRYAVVADYRGATVARAFTTNIFYNAGSTAINTAAGKTHQICASTEGVVTFDREEGNLVGTNFVISPNPPVPVFRLCGETSVLTFNSTSGASVLAASVAASNFTAVARDGWARLGSAGSTGQGIPMIGKAFLSAGLSATVNLGGSWEHRYQTTKP